jgi:hypothetical protein
VSAFTFGLNELNSPEAVPRRGLYRYVPVGNLLLICSSLWQQGDNIVGKRLTKCYINPASELPENIKLKSA